MYYPLGVQSASVMISEWVKLAETPMALVRTPYTEVGCIAIANCTYSNIGVAGFSLLDRDMTCTRPPTPLCVE